MGWVPGAVYHLLAGRIPTPVADSSAADASTVMKAASRGTPGDAVKPPGVIGGLRPGGPS